MADIAQVVRRVLVVEDEYYTADDIARELERRGVEVLGPAPTLKEAIDIAKRAERIDAAVLDINLCGERSLPVAEILAARKVPFVFSTGYDEFVVPEAFRHIPRWQKPFSPSQLTTALMQLMG